MAKNTPIVRTPEEQAAYKARRAEYKRVYDEKRKAEFPKELVRECDQCYKKELVMVETYGKSKSRHFCSDKCRSQSRADVLEGKKASTYSKSCYKRQQIKKGKYVKLGIQAHRPEPQEEKVKVYVDPTIKSRRDHEYWEALRAHKGLI